MSAEVIVRKIDEICKMYGVKTVRELEQLCRGSDEQRMFSRTWNYEDDSWDTRIVNDLIRVPRTKLTKDEKWRVEQIIWMWYHHATGDAISRRGGREVALLYVEKALYYQSRIPNHPNKITKLYHLLLLGKIEEAKVLKQPRGDKEVAKLIIRCYEARSPFEQK